MKEMQERVEAEGLDDVEVRSYMCFGACQEGPNMVVYPDKCWYAGVKSEDVDDVVAYLAGGPQVDRLDKIDPSLKELIYQLLDTGVF